MQPSPTITITCDNLVEFEENAAAFAQGKPDYVNGAAPGVSGESAQAAADSSPPPLTSNQEPKT